MKVTKSFFPNSKKKQQYIHFFGQVEELFFFLYKCSNTVMAEFY